MIHFKRIGNRLLAAVGAIVILGVLVIGMFYTQRQESSVLHENELALAKVTDSVAEGISALMISGHAKVAQEFATRLKTVPNIADYRILRASGEEAFVDNTTVDRVNDKLGEYEFTGRKGTPHAQQIVAPTDPNLEKVRATGQRVFVYSTLPGGERQVTTLSPIRAQKACQKCHEPGESIRGIIKLTTSLKQIDKDIQSSWQMSLLMIALGLVGIVVFVYWVAHRTVVSQIIGISRAMETAATGDLSVRLPDDSRDELGHMARSFNQMNEELLEIYAGLNEERDKLNTIIRGANSGIVVTDAAQRIVLVNEAAREYLGKDEKTIVDNGFLQLFDDPEWMENQLVAAKNTASLENREWKGRILSIQASTIRNANGVVIGSAALIRDITEEKRLENTLKLQSITDALTGLHNRRHFDEVLLREFKRWQRYKQPLSVMMLDVDHFKKFNDAHGHECGDRVLSAIGKVLKGMASASVVPCRYGGEEMVLVMPGVLQAKAVELAEEIRLRIAELVIDRLRVTVSIGVAGCPGHSVSDGEALVKLADNALYRAKEGGRNRVSAAAPEEMQ